jgi:hypothetical protein
MVFIDYTPVGLLSGNENFTINGLDAGFNVLDFWRFQFSNLPDMQGRVGEYIVAKALFKTSPDNNNGWALWDINYRGKRIEVKTTAYFQPWREKDTWSEHRSFGITMSIDPNDKSKKRMNDIYVFVLNKGKNKIDADPLKLEHWVFYVIPTSVINNKCGSNKSITLRKVQSLSGMVDGLSFSELKLHIDKLIDNDTKE